MEHICSDNGLRDMVMLAALFGAFCGCIYAGFLFGGGKK